ncbi:MAG: alpha/beta fold hydrolase [Gemmatimonadota bacterium]
MRGRPATPLRADDRSHTGDDTARARTLAGLPVSDRRLDVAGIPTAVLEGGDGPPLVLLHGQGEFAAVWRRVIPALVRSHRVIVPDLPGHGESEIGDETLDADRTLAWLGDLVDRTCDEPPAVAGHLLGGAIAARFAARRAGRLNRLVLVDSLGLAWFRPALPFAFAMVRFMVRPTERTQDRLFRRCMLDLDGLREEMDGRMERLEAYALDRVRHADVSDALGSLMPRVGVRPFPRAELERIDVPTTLIWGRHDLQVRLRIAESASARYGWPLHVIDDAADDPAVEQPEAFLAALRSALERA